MTIQGLKFWLKLAVYFKTLTLYIQVLTPSVFSLISFKTRNYISEITGLMLNRKLWSSIIALVSLSEGRGFDPHPMLDGSGDKAMTGSISTPNSGSL